MKKLTKNDYEILRVMVEDGITNSIEISRKLNLTDKTIRKRISLMTEMGVYKKAIIVDPKFFGYNLRADFFLKVFKKDIVDITDWLLTKHKHSITYIGRHWGDDNISMQCVFKDGESSEIFENELKQNEFINDYDISIVPIIFKDTYDWRPHENNFNITKKGKEELTERRKRK